jgi:hypothetical protein
MENQIDKREINTAVYNSVEMRTENGEQWYMKEIEFCLQLFITVLEVEVGSGDIKKKTLRLGSRSSGTKRPVLAQFRTSAIKKCSDGSRCGTEGG